MPDRKHTPGPWERIDNADYAEIHTKGQRQKSAIALVATPDDADLIAAAPDLLEALKRAEWHLSALNHVHHPHLLESRQMIRASISKAEGRP